MKQTFCYLGVLVLLNLGVFSFSQDHAHSLAAAIGSVIFTMNTALIVFLARKFFAGGAGQETGVTVNGFEVLFALALKVFGLGASIFICLVLLRLDGAFFVVGAGEGLAALVATISLRGWFAQRQCSQSMNDAGM